MNVYTAMGRLVKDATLEYTPKGTAKGQFTLVVDTRDKDNPAFINCIAFGKTAEILAQYTNKGDQIGIVGSISTFKYEKDGRTVYGWNVIVDRFTFGSKKRGGESESNSEEE